MTGWSFITGLVIAPVVEPRAKSLGWQTVFLEGVSPFLADHNQNFQIASVSLEAQSSFCNDTTGEKTMDTHMHQTALMISKLLTAAELSLETAAAPHTQQVVDAQTKLRKAIGEWDLCKQAAGEAAADAEILRSTKSKMTARPGSIAAQSMAEALAGANSLKQSSTQALAAAQLAMKIAEAEVKEAQAPYQAELDLVDGLRSLQRTFDTERTSMEKAVAASAVSQYQNECAQATRDYVKPNAEMTWEERRDSDRTR